MNRDLARLIIDHQRTVIENTVLKCDVTKDVKL